MSLTINSLNKIKEFFQQNKILKTLALGVAVMSNSITYWMGRLTSWILNSLGTTKKIRDLIAGFRFSNSTPLSPSQQMQNRQINSLPGNSSIPLSITPVSPLPITMTPCTHIIEVDLSTAKMTPVILSKIKLLTLGLRHVTGDRMSEIEQVEGLQFKKNPPPGFNPYPGSSLNINPYLCDNLEAKGFRANEPITDDHCQFLEDQIKQFINHSLGFDFHQGKDRQGKQFNQISYGQTTVRDYVRLIEGGRFCFVNYPPSSSAHTYDRKKYGNGLGKFGSTSTPNESIFYLKPLSVDDLNLDNTSLDQLISDREMYVQINTLMVDCIYRQLIHFFGGLSLKIYPIKYSTHE